jgi:uncharacterized protein (DUF1501 family)
MTRMLTRRAALLGLGGVLSLGRASLALAAAPTEKRLAVVILRGALDGLSAVVPYGDAALAGLRGGLMPPEPGQEGGLGDLGGFFGLHPALAGLHGMFAAGEALAVHAIAGSWRNRSHFEAQDWMEFGAEQRLDSGWLNRVAGALGGQGERALAVGSLMPVLLRGPAAVGSWLPPSFAAPSADLYARIAALHAGDAVTGPPVAAGMRERGFAGATLGPDRRAPERFGFPALAEAAGRMLAAADGPRLAALELGGWDTHANQAGRLPGTLRQLDAGLVALRDGLGTAWRDTVVLVMTEFGRTVRVNGTGGTDHGTGAVAFLLGGRVAGGRVLGDWPGLAPGRLFEGRDLAPTSDLAALTKGVLAAHLGLPAGVLARVFPGSLGVTPMAGLLRG